MNMTKNDIRYVVCALALAALTPVMVEAATVADKARTIVSTVRARLALIVVKISMTSPFVLSTTARWR